MRSHLLRPSALARTVTRRPGRPHGVLRCVHMRSAALVLALVATACGNDPAPRPAPSSPAPVSSPAPTSASPSATPSIAVETTDAHFSTPTKNIGCYVGREGASCQISQYTWELPPRPASCDADWGAGLGIDGRDGSVEVGYCGTDTVMGAERVLAYGTGVEVAPFRCVSETAGLTCVHLPTGKGFFLSRGSYRLL